VRPIPGLRPAAGPATMGRSCRPLGEYGCGRTLRCSLGKNSSSSADGDIAVYTPRRSRRGRRSVETPAPRRRRPSPSGPPKII
jgi:hypothetical protein